MCDDRTSEFQALARSLPGSNRSGLSSLNSANGGGPSSNATASSDLRAFHKTAADISRDIAATSAMLQELAQLVRQKSIFADDSSRINGLVMKIKGSVENLNGRLDEAGAVIAQHKRRLGKNSQVGQEASNLVGQLKEEFVEATAGFKKVLQQRTDVMKETSDMKRAVYGGIGGDGGGPEQPLVSLENKPAVYSDSNSAFGSGGVGGAGMMGGAQSHFPTIDLTSGMAAGESTSSATQLPRPHGASGLDAYGGSTGLNHRNAALHDGSIPTYSGTYSSMTSTSPLTPLDIQRMEEESGQSQMMQLIPDQDYLRERADAMTQVETNIVELGTIFNKLATMVSEHKEMVQRVEDNVDDANANINLGMNALTDTFANLQTNRALFFKVFAVLVIFIIFFVVFLA